MKKLKQSTIFAALVLFFITIATSVPLYAAKKTVILKLISSVPPNDYPVAHGFNEMAKRFNEKVGVDGGYKLEVHYGGALAKVPEYFDAVRVGAVEMASISWTIFSFLDPKLGIIEAPFLFESREAALHAFKKLLPLYDKLLQEKFNAKALGITAWTASEIISSKPIKTLDDIQGIMMGAVSPVQAAMIRDLGGSPVTIMWTDTYEALQKNMIDSTVFMIHPAKIMSLFDICDYATIAFGPLVMDGMTINLDVWNKMPKHIQNILQEEVTAAYAWLTDEFPKVNQQSIKDLQQKGVKFYHLPPEERAKWVARTAEYREKQLTQNGEFGRQVKEIVAEANRLYPYKSY